MILSLSFEREAFQGLEVTEVRGNLSKKEYALRLSMSFGRPYVKHMDNSAEHVTITHCKVKLTLYRKEGETTTIMLEPEEATIPPIKKKISFFSTNVTPKDIEDLNAWRQGNDLTIGYSMEGYAIGLDGPLFGKPVRFEMTNESVEFRNKPRLTSEEINEKLLKGAKIEDEYITSFPLQANSVAIVDSEIDALYKNLSGELATLKVAVEALREAQNIKDFKSAMGHARSAVDSIRNYLKGMNTTSIAKKLFVDTGVITGDGGQEAAEEFIEDIRQTVESTFDMTSKAVHGVTRKNKKSFRPNAQAYEAKMSITKALVTTNYMLDAIKRFSGI